MSLYRGHRKQDITDHVLLHIFSYIHPQFHFLIMRCFSRSPETMMTQKLQISLIIDGQFYLDNTFKAILTAVRFREDATYYFARNGDERGLQWAISNNFPIHSKTMEGAAIGGHTSIINFLSDHGVRWDTNTCRGAAKGGQLQVLQMLHRAGCPWNVETCNGAARGGHLDMLQWCRLCNCPWSESTCSWAADEGHLNILQWAHENGCPWDAETCREAVISKY